MPPTIVIIAGPNGAGKTTISRPVLADTLGITEFVNADTLAAGLSGFNPEQASFAAGRIMLARLHELADARTSFAFETTLASRTLAPWLARLTTSGHELHIIYLWLRTADLAVRRVKARVRKGGHDVPESIIRRRYTRSAANLFRLYIPLADTWRIYDNSGKNARLIAHGGRRPPAGTTIFDRASFAELREAANAKAPTPPTHEERL